MVTVPRPSGRVQRSKQQPNAPGLPRPVPRPPNRADCPLQAQKHRPQRLPPNQHPLPKPLRRPPGATKPAIPAWRLCSPVPSRHVLKPASPLRRVQRLQPRNRQPPSQLPHRPPRRHQNPPPRLPRPSQLAPPLRQARTRRDPRIRARPRGRCRLHASGKPGERTHRAGAQRRLSRKHAPAHEDLNTPSGTAGIVSQRLTAGTARGLRTVAARWP